MSVSGHLAGPTLALALLVPALLSLGLFVTDAVAAGRARPRRRRSRSSRWPTWRPCAARGSSALAASAGRRLAGRAAGGQLTIENLGAGGPGGSASATTSPTASRPSRPSSSSTSRAGAGPELEYRFVPSSNT